MGVNILWVFQAYKSSQWIDVPSEYDGDRDYYLYSWLRQITKLRGFPVDFLVDEENSRHPLTDHENLPFYRRKCASGDQGFYIFMGEWGFSWLLGTEIINARIPVEQMKIWIPIDVYNEWDKSSNPKVWFELHSDWQQHDD